MVAAPIGTPRSGGRCTRGARRPVCQGQGKSASIPAAPLARAAASSTAHSPGIGFFFLWATFLITLAALRKPAFAPWRSRRETLWRRRGAGRPRGRTRCWFRSRMPSLGVHGDPAAHISVLVADVAEVFEPRAVRPHLGDECIEASVEPVPLGCTPGLAPTKSSFRAQRRGTHHRRPHRRPGRSGGCRCGQGPSPRRRAARGASW